MHSRGAPKAAPSHGHDLGAAGDPAALCHRCRRCTGEVADAAVKLALHGILLGVAEEVRLLGGKISHFYFPLQYFAFLLFLL